MKRQKEPQQEEESSVGLDAMLQNTRSLMLLCFPRRVVQQPDKCRLIHALLWILGFPPNDPLLDEEGVLFHHKMRLQPQHQSWMERNTSNILQIAGLCKGKELERVLYGKKGLAHCYFMTEQAPEFDLNHPFRDCPRLAVRNLLGRLLKSVLQLRLDNCDQAKNQRLSKQEEVLIPQNVCLAPRDWRTQLSVTPYEILQPINVYRLKLGPRHKVVRMYEMIHDAALKKDFTEVVEKLQPRVKRYKEELAIE